MKKSFSRICISLNGCNSNLTILNQPWTIEYDPNQGIIIIKDSAGNSILTMTVLDIDHQGNYHVKCGDREYLIYIDGDCLYIKEKK